MERHKFGIIITVLLIALVAIGAVAWLASHPPGGNAVADIAQLESSAAPATIEASIPLVTDDVPLKAAFVFIGLAAMLAFAFKPTDNRDKIPNHKSLGACAALLALVLVTLFCPLGAPTAGAQTLSISAVTNALTSSGATITGSVTVTNSVSGGLTNTAAISVFVGGSNGGTTATAWARQFDATGAFTNNHTYSIAVSGFSPGVTLLYRARAQDVTGEAWSNLGTFSTTATAAALGDRGWREGLRAGSNVVAVVTIGGTNYTAGITTVTNTAGAVKTVLTLTP